MGNHGTVGKCDLPKIISIGVYNQKMRRKNNYSGRKCYNLDYLDLRGPPPIRILTDRSGNVKKKSVLELRRLEFWF